MTLGPFLLEFGMQVAQELFARIDAETMEAAPLYLLPPPALRPGCPAGNICAEETFHTLDGFPVSIFVPEAGCPIHDPED